MLYQQHPSELWRDGKYVGGAAENDWCDSDWFRLWLAMAKGGE
jgi:hypothetical protein